MVSHVSLPTLISVGIKLSSRFILYILQQKFKNSQTRIRQSSLLWIQGIKTVAHGQNLQKIANKILKAWNLKFWSILISFVTQVLSLLESLYFFISALVLGLLELILLSSLMVQVLGMFEPAIFTFFGSGFDHIRANLCTAEVHVLSMSEPLPFSVFSSRSFFF